MGDMTAADDALASVMADAKAGLPSVSMRVALTLAAEMVRLRRKHDFLRRQLGHICKASDPSLLIEGAASYLAGTDIEGNYRWPPVSKA
jgi:hypothetical protein